MSVRGLTDEELALLDGRCRPEVQTDVDAAKGRIAARERYPHLPPEHAAFVADVVREARENRRLVWHGERVDRCNLCGWRGEYARYKSGPRKGLIRDRAQRGTTAGVELARRFVTTRGAATLGGCYPCVESLVDTLAEALRGVEAEVPDRLRADGEPRRVRHERMRCVTCGWEGHDGEMGRVTTVMGDGSFPGRCPSCGVEQTPMGHRMFEALDGFVVVEAAEVAP